MKGSSLPSLLVILSLGALVLAGLASAACSVDDGAADDAMIRLPSEGVTDDGEEEVGVGERPWKCCDTPKCTRTKPPSCRCMDTVRRCFHACKHCKEVRPGSHRFHCLDVYKGPPGPKCTKADDETNQGVTGDGGVINGDAEVVEAVEAAVPVTAAEEEELEAVVPATEAEEEEEENAVGKRPWKCCNKPSCTKSNPPICHCMDIVRRCSSACKHCKETKPGSHRFRCLDAYKGKPGPKCTQLVDDETNHGVACAGGVANGDVEVQAVEEAVVVTEKAEEEEEEENAVEKRPWKCCNKPSCTNSHPPICHCMDIVRRCSSACKHCKETKPGSHRFRCLDAYKGKPGPKCTQVDDETNHGVACAGGVTNGDAEVEALEAALPVTEKAEEEEGENAVEKRPWKCCNKPSCTKSNPPICHCMDIVRRCSSTCKHCKEVKPGSDTFRCLDAYKGKPGPKCTQLVDDETNHGVACAGGVANGDVEVQAVEEAVVVTEKAEEEEEEENAVEKRPWKCCNKPSCTNSHPPICHCMDIVRRCSSACKHCKETKPGSHRFRCLDAYKGKPGPKCTQVDDETNHGVACAGGVTNGDAEVEALEAALPVTEKAEEEEGENAVEKRPWKCCNKPSCTKSNPPICHCMDIVRRCSSTCKHCKEVKPGSDTFRCLDAYKGKPGPKCTQLVDDETNHGVACAGGVANGDVEVQAVEEAVVVTEKAEEEEEEENAVEKRPWKCCNKPSCTNSHPPICHCMDIVRRCSSTCKHCKEVKPGSDTFRCLDAYKGKPGPKCPKDDGTSAIGGGCE